jgi:hypothetical protein
VHFARRDAVERLTALRTFYGAPWSAWHRAWLARTGITHVLVHDRCVPAWERSVPSELHLIAASGSWRAYAVAPLVDTEPLPPPPAWTDITPTLGSSDCLYGRRH